MLLAWLCLVDRLTTVWCGDVVVAVVVVDVVVVAVVVVVQTLTSSRR